MLAILEEDGEWHDAVVINASASLPVATTTTDAYGATNDDDTSAVARSNITSDDDVRGECARGDNTGIEVRDKFANFPVETDWRIPSRKECDSGSCTFFTH